MKEEIKKCYNLLGSMGFFTMSAGMTVGYNESEVLGMCFLIMGCILATIFMIHLVVMAIKN